ncbi:hypothetical protein OKW96_18930 [Sphingobacterium sp. KU25419]|nr:hypothetical protein OKW96_18930 [Sphingobacterium sp. KU25419]
MPKGLEEMGYMQINSKLYIHFFHIAELDFNNSQARLSPELHNNLKYLRSIEMRDHINSIRVADKKGFLKMYRSYSSLIQAKIDQASTSIKYN